MRMLLTSRHPPLSWLKHCLHCIWIVCTWFISIWCSAHHLSISWEVSKEDEAITELIQKSPSSSNANLKLLTVTNPKHFVMSMSNDADRIIIDSGASTSGTKLINIKPTSCSVTAAFGESLQPTETGLLPPLMLETIIIVSTTSWTSSESQKLDSWLRVAKSFQYMTTCIVCSDTLAKRVWPGTDSTQ